MKKFISAFLSLVLLLSLAACGGNAAPETPAPAGFEGTVEEAIDALYSNHKTIDLSLMTMTVDLADVNSLKYNTGLASADLLDSAAISEALMGQAYSLVMVKVKDPADAASVAKTMYDSIDQRKWICVEADTKVAAYSGDLVMFYMVDSGFEDASTASILEAFGKICGGTATQVG